jgi:hypothetical protein
MTVLLPFQLSYSIMPVAENKSVLDDPVTLNGVGQEGVVGGRVGI